jgi:hypothetical protein
MLWFKMPEEERIEFFFAFSSSVPSGFSSERSAKRVVEMSSVFIS